MQTSSIPNLVFASPRYLIGVLMFAAMAAQATTATYSAKDSDFSLSMARAQLARQGVAHPTVKQVETSRQAILIQREEGKGWGQIAHSSGLNLGKVISASRHGSQADKSGHPGHRTAAHHHNNVSRNGHEDRRGTHLQGHAPASDGHHHGRP